MTELVALIVIALAAWAHPTNSIVPENHAWVVPETAVLNGYDADAYPETGGICHIRVNQNTWPLLPYETKKWIITHEIGHCLGIWTHVGDGIMGCGHIAGAQCLITLADRERMSILHPALVRPQLFTPMVAQ